MSYEEDLWDRLDKISAFHKHGSKVLTALQSFSTSYIGLVKKFSEGLQKCSAQFEKDVRSSLKEADSTWHGSSSQKCDTNEMEFSTLCIAVGSVRKGID